MAPCMQFSCWKWEGGADPKEQLALHETPVPYKSQPRKFCVVRVQKGGISLHFVRNDAVN